MEKGKIEQVVKDSNILHDFVNEFYEGHDYDYNGNVTNNINAKIALYSLREYIADLIGEEDE